MRNSGSTTFSAQRAALSEAPYTASSLCDDNCVKLAVLLVVFVLAFDVPPGHFHPGSDCWTTARPASRTKIWAKNWVCIYTKRFCFYVRIILYRGRRYGSNIWQEQRRTMASSQQPHGDQPPDDQPSEDQTLDINATSEADAPVTETYGTFDEALNGELVYSVRAFALTNRVRSHSRDTRLRKR